MDFETVNHLEHPASLVLETMIRNMEALVPFLKMISPDLAEVVTGLKEYLAQKS